MRALVKVTKEVLFKAKYCSYLAGNIGRDCGIGVAVNELLPHSWVEGDQILVYRSEEDLIGTSKGLLQDIYICAIPLSVEVTNWIGEFDRSTSAQRANMKPFSFEIDIPEEVIQLVGIGEVYKILSESKTLEMVMTTEVCE